MQMKTRDIPFIISNQIFFLPFAKMIASMSLKEGSLLSRRQRIISLKGRIYHERLDHAFTMIRYNWAARIIQNFVRCNTQLLSNGYAIL